MTVLCSGILHFLLLTWGVLGGEALISMDGVLHFTMAFHSGLSGPVLMMWPEACFMLSQLSLYSWLDGGSVLSSFWGSNKKII